MINTTQKRKPGFQKGQIANPKGRPVGSYTEAKRKFIEVQNRAAGDADKVYDMIWERMLAGESWAYQIFYKEHYSLPKAYKQDTITLPRVDSKDPNNINTRLRLLIEAMGQFDSYTYDELLGLIKALTNIKSNQIMENQAEHVRLTREELGQKIENFVKAMPYMKKEEGDEIDE